MRLAGFALLMLVVVPAIAWWTPPFRAAHWRPRLDRDAFMHAALATRLHALAILSLVLACGVVLSMPKGDRRHRLLGRTWMVGMLAMAAGSSTVPHGSSALVAYAGGASAIGLMGYGYWSIRRRKIGQHARTMILLMLALCFMALLALMPGRLLHAVVFGG